MLLSFLHVSKRRYEQQKAFAEELFGWRRIGENKNTSADGLTKERNLCQSLHLLAEPIRQSSCSINNHVYIECGNIQRSEKTLENPTEVLSPQTMHWT